MAAAAARQHQVLQYHTLVCATDVQQRSVMVALENHAGAFAQNISCRIQGEAEGLPIATCRLDGQSVRTLTREPAAYTAVQAWR